MSQPKRSIFAQRMKQEREATLKNDQPERKNYNAEYSFGSRSYIVQGKEAGQIHVENLQRLSELTEAELKEERENLIKEFKDTNLLEFLKDRRIKRDLEKNNRVGAHEGLQKEEGLEKDERMDIPSSSNFVDTDQAVKISHLGEVKELVRKYPHMDVVERAKLEWMGDLPLSVPPPAHPYPARFNFEGELLPYCDGGEGVLKGLHNHGEEPERPGYTLQELIQLSRSSVLQQRVISLNTLANIMANAFRYDPCFDEPILPALLEADLFLLLRFSLDDPALPVVMASASALSNLVVNHVDEMCLDNMLGTPLGIQQPSLGVILDMKQNEIEELKDQQLLKLDLIRGALRTDLLQRIVYVLTEMKPEPMEVKVLLKMLTRIARHSYEMANAVFSCPNLLKTVRELLEVQRSPSFYPEALKLFRIIACRSHSLAQNIAENYDILKPIFNFIAGEKAEGHPESMHLALESFYSWQSLLSYGILTSSIGLLSPVLMRLAEVHFRLTRVDGGSQLDLEHGAALVSTVSVVAKLDFGQIRHTLPLILQATAKWASQYTATQRPKFSASKLVGSCLSLFAVTYSDFDSGSILQPLIDKLLRSPIFSQIMKDLRNYSWLVSGEIISSADNLPCLGSIPATINDGSSFPFVYSLAAYILASRKNSLLELFISNTELISYIKIVLEGENITKLCGHWYARQELHFLIMLVHIYTAAQVRENQKVFHKLAFRLLTSVQTGDKVLLPDIISKTIFNKMFFSLDIEDISRKLKELKVEEESANEVRIQRRTHLEGAIEALGEMERMYIRELGLEGLVQPRPPLTLTGLLNSTQSALPQDWPFLPILRLYDRQGVDNNAVTITKLTLQWFIIIEEILPEMFPLNTAAKYCRLSCVYLAGNDLFRDVSILLEAALYYIQSKQDKLDFGSPIPGLISFYDFYRELLEQFTAVSYGDSVFGQFVLLPLQQKYDIKYKKIVWSELAAILRLLRTSVAEVGLRDYLEPLETDPDLLGIYLYALATGRVREMWCPVLYRMALHHVATYTRTRTDQVAHALRTRINTLGNQELKELLLNYDCSNFIC